VEKRESILLVEDEVNLHEALKLNLELDGYEVTSAYDGVQAINAVKNEVFSLIILDIMLPQLDGFSVLETIRLQQNTVPVLILSAKTTDDDRVKGLKAGADDYLIKPFNLEELLLRVKLLIAKSYKMAQAAPSTVVYYQFGW
jgi:two-component system, OmpR family, alkaline phosphatase synthesis response regulator PhoP